MRSDEPDLLKSIDLCGRSSPPDAIDYLAKYADHPSDRVRSWTVEALNRLDTADADLWIVAIGVREHDEVARLTVCRAAGQASLLALAPALAAWVRDETASDILRRDAALALGHMQATSVLLELLHTSTVEIPPNIRSWLEEAVASAPAGRSNRDRMRRLPTPFDPAADRSLNHWSIWHDDATVTEVLDDGSAIGPDFRRLRSFPVLSWWPADVERRARVSLRAELVRLYQIDQELMDRVSLAALKTDAAPSILGFGFRFTLIDDDEALPLLDPLLDSENPLIRAAAWREAAKLFQEQLWPRAVERLSAEAEPAVRHMLVRCLYGRQDERALDAVAAALASGDHVERIAAAHAAALCDDPALRARLKEVATSDSSALARMVAGKEIGSTGQS